MVHAPPLPNLVRRLPSGRVPRAAIRKYVNRIIERFHPEKVILFGSHAYGKPHPDSDIDLLIIMPTKNMVNAAIRVRWEIPAPVPDGPTRPHAGIRGPTAGPR